MPGQPGGGGAHRGAAARRRRAAARSTLEIIPGLSFADLAWSRLGVDPMDGARLVDGQRFAIDAAGLHGPLLIGHCDQPARALRHEARAARGARRRTRRSPCCSGSGSPTSRSSTVPLEELDRDVEPDHLTSVFVDAGDGGGRGRVRGAGRAVRAAARRPAAARGTRSRPTTRSPRYLLEEAYEMVEAIEGLPADAPAGDVRRRRRTRGSRTSSATCSTRWCSTRCSRARPARSRSRDVARGIHEKLVRRHPARLRRRRRRHASPR